MVDIILILTLTATVISSVTKIKKIETELKDLKRYTTSYADSSFKTHMELKDKVKSLDEDIKQSKKDVEAIAGAINVYSATVQGSVEDKVKANVDLFAEWLNGDE